MKIEKISIDGVVQDANFDETQLKWQGKGAFETFRVHENKAFLLNEHFERLNRSLKALKIKWDDDRQKYYGWLREICKDIPEGMDGYIRFIVREEGANSSVEIQLGHLPPFMPIPYEAVILENIHLQKLEYFSAIGFRIKSIDYISLSEKEREAMNLADNQEGILLTPEGYVAEALSANVVWAKGGKLYTPPLQTGILAGTLRAYLLANNEIEETLAKQDSLLDADEIMLSSGARYLRPLAKINGVQPAINGPVFSKLYGQLKEDIAKQAEVL